MANQTADEMETHFNIVASDRKTVIVFSDDPVWVARLDKIATGTVCGDGKEYKLHIDQLVIRKGKKQMSDAQKQAAGDRMRQMHRIKEIA